MADEETKKTADAGTEDTAQGVTGAQGTQPTASTETLQADSIHAEAAESVSETRNDTDSVVAHDGGEKPSNGGTEAEDGNCGCGNDACECGKPADTAEHAETEAAGDDGRPPKPGDSCGCGCGTHSHDGKGKASGKDKAPHAHKGHDTLLLALGIVGVVLGASGLAVACSMSNEVATLKSEVSSIQSDREDASILSPFGLPDNDNAYEEWLNRHGLSDSNGKVGFIGVRVQDSTTGTDGAEVVGVSTGEPADKAGIEKGDVIVSFGGESVSDADDLVALVRDAEIGSTQSVVVVRDGEQKTLSVTVGSTTGGSSSNTSTDSSDSNTNSSTDDDASNSTLDGGGDLRSN